MGCKPSRSDTADDDGWLSESVYEMYEPENEDEIECEIVFFHGLQVTADRAKVRQAYRKTWLTADGKECWLQTFLPRAFSNKIRVLSVTYDSSAFTTADTGRFDLFLTGEKLVASVIRNQDVNVGQRGVPVFLVGHSFGGFALKKMVVHADHQMDTRPDSSEEIVNFLGNLKGVFFYATPHLGASLARYLQYLPSCVLKFMGPVLSELRPLDNEGARLNRSFERMKTKHNITTMSVIETQRMPLVRPLSVTVVSQGSGRYSETVAIGAHHTNICKPDSERSERFTLLRDFIRRLLRVSKQTGAVENA